MYQRTEIRTDVYEERRRLGRNIRGLHAETFLGKLEDVEVLCAGAVFTEVKLRYALEGTRQCDLFLKLYQDLPRLEFKLQLAKTMDTAVENVFLSLTLDLPDALRLIDKGGVLMAPGIDQVPGTCAEYYLTNNGLLYREPQGDTVIQTLDVPLLYTGSLDHHPIELCNPSDGARNRQDIYSWIMNNTWETNFKMDLSGITEYRYVLHEEHPNANEALREGEFSIVTFLTD